MASFSHSPLGNNQYNKSPYKLPQMKCCDFFKAFYYDYQDTFLNETNFPVSSKEGFCPFPKVS